MIPVEFEAKFQGDRNGRGRHRKTLFRIKGEIEWGPTRVEITADITAVLE